MEKSEKQSYSKPELVEYENLDIITKGDIILPSGEVG